MRKHRNSIPKHKCLLLLILLATIFAFSCSSTDIPELPEPALSSSLDEVSSSSLGNEISSSSRGGSSSSSSYGFEDQFEDWVFTDTRDNKKYRYEATSSGQIWMSDNLNFSNNNTVGFCYGVDVFGENPNRDSTTCDNGYGRSYTHSVAIAGNSPQGLCPNGWHIPSTTEWNTTITTSNMSSSFYIRPGNYNLNNEYPPLGWKSRNEEGFYWTSSGASYFVGFWGNDLKTTENSAGTNDYFSVRCVADGDLNCNGIPYASATKFCSSQENKIYEKCNGTSYNTETQGCIDNVVLTKCGSGYYNPTTHSCIVTNILKNCGSYVYNEQIQFCYKNEIYDKCGSEEYDVEIEYCLDGNVFSNLTGANP